MLQSPAKRRKISENTSRSTSGSNTEGAARPQPTTPTRASYASPTKASLARSHPNILARSPGRRSAGGSANKNLRQELLGARRTQSAKKSSHDTTSNNQAALHQDTNDAPKNPAANSSASNGDSASFSAAIARAFEVARAPLSVRQPSAQNPAPQVRAGSVDEASPFILPKLVEKPSAPPGPIRQKSNEPDLPPTSVQLGLHPAPDRPRGLASSSSPRSSKSGSGKNRRRLRDSAITSSPLKPKDPAPERSTTRDTDLLASSRDGFAEEAPESEADNVGERLTTRLRRTDRAVVRGEPLGEPGLDQLQQMARMSSRDDEHSLEEDTAHIEELRERSELRNTLQSQLQRLKSDMKKLEAAANSTDKIDQHLLTLLTTTNPSCAAHPPNPGAIETKPANIVALGDQPLPYLTLFAPGNLALTTMLSTRTVRGRIQTTHAITVSAPPPWPPHVFTVTFEVVVDAENTKVESVKLREPKKKAPGSHLALQKWIDTRLEIPLHKFDTGGLVWGIGMYFDECVKRTRVFHKLDKQFQGEEVEVGADIKTLLPYISAAKLELSLEGATERGNKRKRSRFPQGKKILLTWNIEMDWTGETSASIEIAATGVPRTAQERVKEIFATLLASKGVVEAVGGVRDVLSGCDVHGS